MIKSKCQSCGTLMGIPQDYLQNNPELQNKQSLNLKCPNCKTINKVAVNLNQPSLEQNQINDFKTRVDIPNLDEKTRVEVSNQESKNDENIAWLVVHDEFTHQQTFQLKLGKNTIGRKSPSMPCSIMVDTNDGYMSRNHLTIEVLRQNEGYIFVIYDSQSTNGTFVNAMKRLSPNDRILLSDGDILQLGRTKLVLKTSKSATNSNQASEQVSNTDFFRTVVIQ